MNWIPALSSTGVLAVLGSIASVPYRKTIEEAISLRFNSRLEEIKAIQRRDEERLRAELKARDAEIEALRTSALSGFASRSAEMSRRRILAVERVWAHVVEIAPLKTLSRAAESLNMDAIFERAARSSHDRQRMSVFAEGILKIANATEIKSYDSTADKEQPFVPELVWALFTAYRQLLAGPYLQLMLLKSENDRAILKEPDEMAGVLKSALPHQADFIDQHGASGFPFLVDELEQALLRSLRVALSQAEADSEAISQAAEIMRQVSEITRKRDIALPTLEA